MELITPEEEAHFEAVRAACRADKGNQDLREELKALSLDHSLRRQYWRRIGVATGTALPGPKVENNT